MHHRPVRRVGQRARDSHRTPARAARPKPEASGRERFWWYFMRISGLALVFLALGHMFIMHVLVELSGGEIDFAFVQSRWGTPFWRIYDLLLLADAQTSGGLLVVGAVRPPWARVVLVAGIGSLLALGWEIGEWYTFIRHGTEIETAYEDTLGDMTLGDDTGSSASDR